MSSQFVIHEFEQLAKAMLGEFVKEARELIPGRDFRADYYFPRHRCIVEINGGQWANGRHNRAAVAKRIGGTKVKTADPKTGKTKTVTKGGTVITTYEQDLTKANLAQLNGFTYLQYTYEQLLRREYIQQFATLKTMKP